jgi:hypothetical protein
MSDTETPNPNAPAKLTPRRSAQNIGWHLNYDRTRPAAQEREAYLRRLMGLPEKPALDDGRDGK